MNNMVAIFSKSTCVLSKIFVEWFEPNELAERLKSIGKETGIEFKTLRDSKSYSISGEWNVILEAHRLLSEYYDAHFENEYTENDALTVKERRNYSNINLTYLDRDKSLHGVCFPKPIVIYDGDIHSKGETPLFKNDTYQDRSDGSKNYESDKSGIEECVSDFYEKNVESCEAVSPVNLTEESEKHLDGSSNDSEENYIQRDQSNPVSVDLSNEERDEFKENQDALHKVEMKNNSKRTKTVSEKTIKTRPRKSKIVKSKTVNEDIDYNSENSCAETESEDESETIKPEFKCFICQKAFYVIRDLQRHEREVHTEASYCCKLCNKLYTSRRNYKNHLNTHKEDYVKPWFACKCCPKSYASNHHLKVHVEAEHFERRKSYVCPTCNKSFKTRATYFSHAKVHAGIKPYVCDVCGKSFSLSKALKSHKYLHEDTKQFQCEVCSNTFRQESSLRIHKKIHNTTRDYICAVCAKGFTQKQALIRHERIHSGEKPFSCGICNRNFSDSSIVRRHMILIHKKDSKDWHGDMISNVIKDNNYFVKGSPGDIDSKSNSNIPEPKIFCNFVENEYD